MDQSPQCIVNGAHSYFEAVLAENHFQFRENSTTSVFCYCCVIDPRRTFDQRNTSVWVNQTHNKHALWSKK